MHTEKWKLGWKRPVILHNKPTSWMWMVSYPGELRMGEYVDIGAFTYINAVNGVIIGENVEIGSHCAIYSESTIDGKKGMVVIEDDVCIGSHSTVMPGVTIGRGTTIGAHSFVSKNIPANVVAYGVPAMPAGEIIKRKCGCHG